MFRILLFFSLFLSYFSYAQELFEDEVLQNLYDYRMSIEEESYSTSISLCSLYSNVVHSQDNPHTEGSKQAWSKILYEGAAQPVSAIGGKKADYLGKTHAGFFEMKSWFYSLYVLFLVNSDGFKKGAQECLGNNPEDIKDFINTIKIVDIIGSSGFYAVELVTFAKLFSLILKAFSFIKAPVSKLYFKSLEKMHIPPRYAKYTLLGAAGTGVGALGLLLHNKYQEKRAQEEYLRQWIEEELESSNESELDE